MRHLHGDDHDAAGPSEDLFASLYALRPQIHAFVRRRGADRWTAEDIVNDMYLVVWRRIDDIPPDNARAWLFGAARKLVANAHRAARRRIALADRITTQPRTWHVVDAALSTEERHLLIETWLSLPAGDRDVLAATSRGLGRSDLAGLLGCSEAAAAMRLSRARARLAGAFDTC